MVQEAPRAAGLGRHWVETWCCVQVHTLEVQVTGSPGVDTCATYTASCMSCSVLGLVAYSRRWNVTVSTFIQVPVQLQVQWSISMSCYFRLHYILEAGITKYYTFYSKHYTTSI